MTTASPNISPAAASAADFSQLPLTPAMLANLQQLGYLSMTAIQAASLPAALLGKDIIAQAKTGSGKTAAFALTLLANLNPRRFAVQTLVRSLLDNLLRNAWKFSARKEITHIDVGSKTLNGETVFFVRDNGCGFDMASADRLFGPFQRLHREDEYAGTGIGLTIVQRIVMRHGGRVWAFSEPGLGAAFHFTLST